MKTTQIINTARNRGAGKKTVKKSAVKKTNEKGRPVPESERQMPEKKTAKKKTSKKK